MVNVASRGALMDKNLVVVRNLISNMARGANTSRVMSKFGAFDNLQLENQVIELTRFRIQRGEESAPCGYEAIENYHNWTSLSRVYNQPKLKPNRELNPVYNNQPKAFHYHSPTKQAWERDLRSMKIC
ncbi:hypothetical protein CR513_20377, partial [Mucuna pruriens]